MVLAKGGIDHIFIETSGVSDPSPVLETFTATDLAFSTHIHALVLVADVLNFADSSATFSDLVRAQLLGCDMVLLSKVDLAGEDQISGIEEQLQHMCTAQGSSVPIIRMKHGEVPISLILGVEPQQQHRSKHPDSSQTPVHAGFEAVVFESDLPFDPEAFEEYVGSQLIKHVVRAKGTIWLDGIPRTVIFHLVGTRTNPFETVSSKAAPTGSRLVMIGQNIDKPKLQRELEALTMS